MKETPLNAAVNKKLRQWCRDIALIWKINDSYRRGMPDNYYKDVNSLWAEFKWESKPAKQIKLTNKSLLKASQIQEIERLVDLKEQVVVVLATPHGYTIVNGDAVHVPIDRMSLEPAGVRTLSTKIASALYKLIT